MHTSSFTSVVEMTAEYHERTRQWERQIAYEKHIVRSVPVKRIAVSATEPTNSERWEPG